MLKKTCGYIILPKDSILYHTTGNELFSTKPKDEKSMLFCTFHPSE